VDRLALSRAALGGGLGAVGAVSGAMMATTSVGGPPVLLYLLSGNDPPRSTAPTSSPIIS
jgi:hypothetical protein